MPKDTSIHKILLIGSGPIVIGQGCEFDYSGVQACKALKEEGYTVILVNSNPATIMTDPEFAHRTYIEPITPEVVEKIIIAEKPDALLPTLGGQTALNCAMKLFESGVLERHGVKMIGANAAAIHKGEDRLAFKEAMIKIGLDMPKSGVAHTMDEGRAVAAEIGTMPLIIRPAFTLGGTGGGIAYNREEFETIVARGLDMSPVSEVLIEESLLGWKEFEMEVMRDHADNCVIICSIENVDPMGVHTGDSITVAPIQTLTDREFQVMRDASFAIIREIGVETGGSNIQFAVHPDTGRMIVIEMNPRVSRSSALASKATGFPIAKIAAKLAVGYTLDEVRNDITRETPASFEPTIDYVVVKCPRFTFEKFPQADAVLTTQMKSVGEAMAIGRTFKEALQKALRSLEIKRFGLIGDGKDVEVDDETLRTKLIVPNAERIFFLGLAFQRGWTVDEVFELTKIDRWFLENIREIVEASEAFGTQASLPVRPAGFQPAEPDAAGRMPADRTGLKPVFQPFREFADIEVHRRNLPHWEQPGATYFITFRLADSVPSPLLAQWTQEFEAWSRHHPKPWDAKTAYEYLTRFVEPREHWLDQGHGSCALRDPRAAEIVAAALRHFDGERYHLDAFVVMPNHIHVLVMPTAGHSLSDILHSWKSYTATQVNRLLGRTGKFWMEESVDRIVRDWDALVEYRGYIVANPEKAKLGAGQFVLSTVEVIGNTGFQPDEPAGWKPAGRTGRDACVPLRRAKKLGFSDRQLAIATGTTDADIRAQRKAAGIIPTYRLVDTCAAEFEAYTPYYYSTYGDENERRESGKKKVIILGGGPNRIGQGIEFDYCCVHASFALREMGFETIMVNSNPETVSTDYDTSDKLYFEPLTLEDVLNICEQESENLLGVIVQFGGQTPLNLANGLAEAGVPIIGTSPRSIEIAEDRKLFGAMLDKLGIRQTSGGTAVTEDEAVAVANRVTYPVLVRPSFVLGGRGMMLVHNETDLRKYVRDAVEAAGVRSTDLQSVRPATVPGAGSSHGDTASETAAGRTDSKSVLLLQPFAENAPIKKAKRNLPHWTQDGATYFVTFRLADAVPAGLLTQWRDELDTWLKFHPEPWDNATAYEYWQRAFEKHEEWLDQAHGECLLRRPELAKLVAEALRHFHRDRYVLDAFVVMPNHVHVLVKPLPGHELSEILQSWKRFTAREINKALGHEGSVWQDESFDRIVRDDADLSRKRTYIAANPENLPAGAFVLSTEAVLLRGTDLQSCGTGLQPVRPAAVSDAGSPNAYQPAPGTVAGRTDFKSVLRAEHPILVDHFLEDATEVDVDCISDGETVVIGAIMEHIEQAGIHSGDSACVIPPFSLSEKVKVEIATATKAMARELNVIGLMNVQFAVQNETVYVLEVNPRASRTAPFVSKAIGVPLPKLAAKIMAGAKLVDLGFTKEVVPAHYCVKEAVFPFTKFPGTDIVLGPEMKSTGEVMGIDANLGIAYAKAQMAAQPALPLKGNIFLSVSDADKTKVADIAASFAELGFTLYATSGTAAALEKEKVPVKKLFKLSEGRPNALDMLKNGELAMIINTPSGKSAREDEIKIRSTASSSRVPVMTTLRAARASLEGIRSMKASGYSVKPLQEWHRSAV